MNTTRGFEDKRTRWARAMLVMACMSWGLAHPVRADGDVDVDDDGGGPPSNLRFDLPGIRVQVNRGTPVPPPPPAGEAAVVPPPGVIEGASYVVETRGPVHEAFAEPVVFDPIPGVVIPKSPPPPIDEMPPDLRPAGEDMAWIPGYWAWDDDRFDFVWVSGIWRNMPPGRQFVPGYWSRTDEGFQWVSGFWLSDEIEMVQYLPGPPESLEDGPVGEPPGRDHVWVPGLWLWREGGYVWRPGYWMPPQNRWVWVPARYAWSPGGYVFVSGYWDYPLPERGLLFAPVYVPPATVARPAFSYSPSVVVNTSFLVTNLFARPQYRHYYFGDYYAPEYFRTGIYPAYSFHESVGYAPMLVNYMARQGVDRRQVIQRFREDYRFRRDHPDARPPRDMVALRQLAGRRPADPRVASYLGLVEPLRQYVQRPGVQQRFEDVRPDRLNDYRQSVARVRQYQDERRRLETQRLTGTVIGPGDEQPQRIPRLRQPSEQTPPAASPPRVVPREQAPRVTRPALPPARVQPGRRQPPAGDATPQTDSVRPQQRQQVERRQPARMQLKRSPLTGRPLSKIDRSKAPPANPREADPDPRAKPRVRGGERRQPRD